MSGKKFSHLMLISITLSAKTLVRVTLLPFLPLAIPISNLFQEIENSSIDSVLTKKDSSVYFMALIYCEFFTLTKKHFFSLALLPREWEMLRFYLSVCPSVCLSLSVSLSIFWVGVSKTVIKILGKLIFQCCFKITFLD